MPLRANLQRLNRFSLLRLAVAAFLVGGVSGCLETGGTGAQPFAGLTLGNTQSYKKAIGQARLAGGAVVVPAPKGFCVDPKSMRRSSGNSFALLASCAALGAGPDFDASVLTVTVSPRQPGMASPRLKHLVSDTRDKSVLAQRERNGIATVQLAKGGNQHIRKADPKHWRAVFVLNQRMVALAAYGEIGSPIALSSGGEILERLSQSIRKASPEASVGTGLLSALTKPSKTPETQPATSAKPVGFSLFRKPTPPQEPATQISSEAELSTIQKQNPVKNLIGRLFGANQLVKE